MRETSTTRARGGESELPPMAEPAEVEMHENPMARTNSRPESMGGSAPAVPSRKLPAAQPVHVVRALYDYAGQNDDELSIAAGDRVTISAVQDHGQGAEWLHGSLADGRAGIFPANYVAEEDDQQAAAASAVALQ